MPDKPKEPEIINPRYAGATLGRVVRALLRPVKQEPEPKKTVCGTPLVEMGRGQDKEAKARQAETPVDT